MLCILLVRTVVVLLLLVLIRLRTPSVSVSVLIPFFSIPFLVFTFCFVCIITIGSIIPIDDPRTVMIITDSNLLLHVPQQIVVIVLDRGKKNRCYYPSYPIVSIGRCLVVYRIFLSLFTYSYSDLLLLLPIIYIPILSATTPILDRGIVPYLDSNAPLSQTERRMTMYTSPYQAAVYQLQ